MAMSSAETTPTYIGTYIYRTDIYRTDRDLYIGLIGCISLSPSLALLTFFNNNNNNQLNDYGRIEARTVIIIRYQYFKSLEITIVFFILSQFNLNVIIIKGSNLGSIFNDNIRGRGRQCYTQDLLNCARPIRYSVHMYYSATSAFSECGILIISFRL